MDEIKYIEDRLEDQISWYESKSAWNQKCFKRLRFVEILSASLIPFLTGYITDQTPNMKVFVGGLGVIIAVVSGIVTLCKFQEHWLQYRTTSETLKHHKFLYITKTKPYDNGDAFGLLVKSIESLISKENSNWFSYNNKKEGKKNNG